MSYVYSKRQTFFILEIYVLFINVYVFLNKYYIFGYNTICENLKVWLKARASVELKYLFNCLNTKSPDGLYYHLRTFGDLDLTYLSV